MPSARARQLRGGLVGICSALITVFAHAAAGGELPGGAPLMLLAIASATVGATTGLLRPGRRMSGMSGMSLSALILTLSAALGVAQLLGHLILTLAAHHPHGMALTAPMLTLHLGAAIGLGLLIALTEHLYLVCASVLCWLRLIFVDRRRPNRPAPVFVGISVVAQAVSLCSGLGMRAPPRGAVHV